jgi:hypothetical protein
MLMPPDDNEDVEPELQKMQQQGAAITTGMISVTVGLACTENSLYVFFLGGTQDNFKDVSVHLTILLFLSMFPIHALGAAMLSFASSLTRSTAGRGISGWGVSSSPLSFFMERFTPY